MDLLYIALLVLGAFGCAAVFRTTPVIDLPQGKLRGIESLNSRRKYLAIPYATVKDRFLEPGSPPKWSGVFDATDMTVSCKQYIDRLKIALGREDCLVLNIHTPPIEKRLLPVMVFVHGGGYYWGSGTPLIYDPEHLVRKGVIVVTVNYRLGAFGFLCLRIKEAPGNVGLKDLVAALKWIKGNIKYFGGDPNSVTIFGESAGAASVSHLLLSPNTVGLFRGAIMQSGTALSPFAFSRNPITRAAYVAANLGYRTKNPYELLQIFRNTSGLDIVLASEYPARQPSNPLARFTFLPCLEKRFPGTSQFLSKSPMEILKSGLYNKVPVIIGYNNNEGLLYASKYNDRNFENLNDHFEDIIPESLFTNSYQKRSVANEIKSFYFKDRIDRNSTQSLADYYSDMLFNYPSYAKTQLILENTNNSVYNYYFQYDSSRNLGKLYTGLSSHPGATHSDEIFYLFQPIILWPLPTSKGDTTMIDRMTTLWSNFAKTGVPTPTKSSLLRTKWDKSELASHKYYVLDKNVHMTKLPNPRRIQFWANISKKYGSEY